MPTVKRRNIGRRTHNNNRNHKYRVNNEPEEHRQQRLEANQIRITESRSMMTQEQRKQSISTRSISSYTRNNLERRQNRQPKRIVQYERLAFRYDPTINYAADIAVDFGMMNTVCQYCDALRFRHESPGLCCASGKVKLPQLLSPLEPLASLLSYQGTQSKHFLQNIQRYNSSFQMTSFGANITEERGFNPTFKIQGQIHHRTGALLPPANADHKFLQIYFLGNSDSEINRRCTVNRTVKRKIITQLQQLLHEHNQLVKLFKTALEMMPSDDYKIVIRADKRPAGEHERRFNAPTLNEVAIVVVGENLETRDIVVRRRDGQETNKKVSSMNFYAHRLMIRQNMDNHILKCRRLFHQFVVDMYVKVETERLTYIRLNQKKLRSEEYIHLRDAMNVDQDPNNIGRLTILPATYVGSPRHMHEYAQDAMTYVRQYGRPDLFITFTCNPKWEEITQLLLPGQSSSDRHDITARVFKQKLKSLMNFITKYHVFGDVRCWMYSVEWQKRGLPHAHILLWMSEKIRPDEVDAIICAEIPDSETDPELYKVVTTTMIHGPCESHNKESPCMIENKCSKRFPRALLADTITGNDGYPLYRRRSAENNGRTLILKVKNQNVLVDNSWIVPYSLLLSKTFKAHCNVEYCNSVNSIKYICKYTLKGTDMAVFEVETLDPNDEVSRYQMGRYVSSNEAIWRIFSFPIHERYPTVTHLAVHLENGQRVYFTEANAAQKAEKPPTTTLTSFFEMCTKDPFAKTLFYSEMPRYFTWNASSKQFHRRKNGKPVPGYPDVYSTDALGRIYTVHPNNNECFYLRLLLINVRGPTSFQSLRTVNGELCATYREACQRLNLLEDDNHWDYTLADAVISSTAHQIRSLFAIIISTCFPSSPPHLWDKYKDSTAEDILHRVRTMTANYELEFNEEIYNETLILIEDLCLLMSGKTLRDLGMSAPNRLMHDAFNREFEREHQYDRDALSQLVRTTVSLLNQQQKTAYDILMEAVNKNNGGIFFLDAPGGTGKTFLISLILASVRAENQIALAVASSGIAATLLEGGRTAHSAFKLPLNLQTIDDPTCNISKKSAMARVLQNCKVIIWDECTMAHKRALEALDRTLKDLRSNQSLFGGTIILLAGDFRQTLPVISRSTAADEINACLKSSNLWKYVKTIKLTTNMRVALQNDISAEVFSKQLLDIGNGNIPIDDSTGFISFPADFCQLTKSKDELIAKVFPNIGANHHNHAWLSERAILAARNKDVDYLNSEIQRQIDGQLYSFKSIDCTTDPDEAVNYPIEFLNSLDVPGIPPHNLQLKVGSVIIMLRNLNQPKLCNGTRLAVKKLMNNLIEATIITGKFKDEDVLIPRIPMILTDLSFQFKRIQFPVRLAFAMTINKSQGQSLEVCGINLELSCFSHGQLYVACSRVGKPSALFIFSPDGKTKNIVHHQALR
ncbi:uncharacterized protein LOC123270358 [Cotesia glomerata]|uniref:uncharacterized protein LOC123270358 n=1 Tax=Cotesia glomerata TaxID=32391 RepID=UPI001D00CBCC|nr:uncharacterized protein LOC123270358 [Cotesia glomerata]